MHERKPQYDKLDGKQRYRNDKSLMEGGDYFIQQYLTLEQQM